MKLALEKKFVFGPVRSRRLGLSLGIDVVPPKTCTYNCVYCQLGRTTHQTTDRKEYVPVADVMRELEEFLDDDGYADYLTFSGSGEPTLNSKLGEMIEQTTSMSEIPIAVMTCGSLLSDPQVRRELMPAAVVLPSLDSVSMTSFKALNRPHGKIEPARVFRGLLQFREEYQGEIWLEVMLVKDMNDSPEELERLKAAIEQTGADKVHLNTVIRPPAESSIQPLTREELNRIAESFGSRAEVIAELSSDAKLIPKDQIELEVRNLIARHPMTLSEIAETVNHGQESVWTVLRPLVRDGEIHVRTHEGRLFYAVT